MQCGYGDYDSVMRVVAAQLEQGPWLLGERFTAADVLWGGALNYGLMFKLVPDWPVFRDYAERVQARPAIRRATEMDAALAATQARELDEALAAWKIARARELRRAARASIISPIIGNHPHACFIRSCDRGCDRSCGCAAPSACSSSSMPCRDAAPRCRRIE